MTVGAPTFDFLFTDPFSETNAAAANDSRMPVSIGSHAYIVDLKQYRRRTLPVLRNPIDSNSEPGDNSLNTQGLWQRFQWDWRQGAGQSYLDIENSLRRRFFSSKGIDPWNERYFTLLADTEQKLSSANTNLKCFAVGGYGYVIDGTNIRFSSDWTGASPTFTTTNIGSTIKGYCTDGNSVWVAYGGAPPKKATIGVNTYNAFGAVNCDYIFYANGRLLGVAGAEIFELDGAGAKVTGSIDFTHKNSSFAWIGAVGTPSGIYIYGNNGDTGEIYFVDVDTTNGALKSPLYAGGTPYGETLNDLCFYEGAVVFATSSGFRVANLTDSTFALQHGPLTTISGGVKGLDPRGQYIWFGWTNYDGTSTGLGRMDLSLFTDTLVPAYASDIMATTQGTVQDVCTFGSRHYFVVSGAGLYGENSNKVASGNLRTGKVLYSTFVKKNASQLDFRFAALPTGASILAEILDDSGSWTSLVNSTTAASMTPGFLVPVSLSSNNEELELRFTLSRATDTTQAPQVRRWTLQAIATPPRTDEFIVPIIMTPRAVGMTDQPFGQTIYDEFLYLKELETNGQIVEYREGQHTYSVYVDTVETQPIKWADERDFYSCLLVARLLSTKAVT